MKKIKSYSLFKKKKTKVSSDNNYQIKRIETGELTGTPITNSREILNWIVDRQMDDFKNGNKSLTSHLAKELRNVFGASNKKFKGEFNNKIWTLEYRGLVFNIFTAAGKGTSIEIVGHTYEDAKAGKDNDKIIEFLEKLSNQLNKKNTPDEAKYSDNDRPLVGRNWKEDNNTDDDGPLFGRNWKEDNNTDDDRPLFGRNLED